MDDADQLTIYSPVALEEDIEHEGRVAERLMFATDDQLVAWLRPCEERLRVVENYVQDQKARLPGLERECAAIRQNLEGVRKHLERGLKAAA